MKDTIVIADAHLDNLNTELDDFLRFLAALQHPPIRTLYILGDLFTFWIGTPQMQLPYQQAVIKALQALRDSQIIVKYVEGNRDYFLAPLYLDNPFAEIASEYAQEVFGNTRIYFAHGDLVNVSDRQYRLWRRISRSRFIYAGFKRLPRSVAVHVVRYLEHTLNRTNQRHKGSFPLKTCEAYARKVFQAGYDTLVLGHFHEARHHEFSINGQQKSLYVLPAWKDTYTYLRISESGACSVQKFV
jgi:UDP-2,3-diacylglucosamine diphosphatase